MLQVKGFELEGTGGGCEALIARTEKFEYLLTDGDLSAPNQFPVVLSVYNSYSECVYCAEIKDAETLEKIRDCPTETIEAFNQIVPHGFLYELTK
jgi:hypothetical protein